MDNSRLNLPPKVQHGLPAPDPFGSPIYHYVWSLIENNTQVNQTTTYLVDAILAERDRQIRKFGSKGENLNATAWLTILAEEFGEVATAVREGDSDNYAEELVQVAAVAIAALEDYYQREPLQSVENISKPIFYKGKVEKCVDGDYRIATKLEQDRVYRFSLLAGDLPIQYKREEAFHKVFLLLGEQSEELFCSEVDISRRLNNGILWVRD